MKKYLSTILYNIYLYILKLSVKLILCKVEIENLYLQEIESERNILIVTKLKAGGL